MNRIQSFVYWLIKRPWFWGAFLILNGLIPGRIKSNKTFALIYLCLMQLVLFIMLLVLFRLFKLSNSGAKDFKNK